MLFITGKAKVILKSIRQMRINPIVTNGFSHRNHLGESIFILGGSGVIFHFYFIFR